MASGRRFYFNKGGAATLALMNSPNVNILQLHAKGKALEHRERAEAEAEVLANKAVMLRVANPRSDLEFELSKETLYFGGHSMVFPLDWPWMTDVTAVASALNAGGISTHIREKNSPCSKRDTKSLNTKQPIVITLTHLITPTLLWASGLTLALLVFVVEILCSFVTLEGLFE